LATQCRFSILSSEKQRVLVLFRGLNPGCFALEQNSMKPFLFFLLAGMPVLHAVSFDVTQTSVNVTQGVNFSLVGGSSVGSAALPESNGITGFKLYGTAAAGNQGAADCLNCELSVVAAGTLSQTGGGFILPTPVPVEWSFRVDEYIAPQNIQDIQDGTSNTIFFGETFDPTDPCGIQDSTANTIVLGDAAGQCQGNVTSSTFLFAETLEPRRERPVELGGIQDGTSNTILFGETNLTDPRDFIYRLVLVLGSTTTEQIQDGTSNTILLGEGSVIEIATGNGYFGDQITGAGSFLLAGPTGPFSLALQIRPTNVAPGRGILLTIPQDSVDINPVGEIPEPGAWGLTAIGLCLFSLQRSRRSI